MNRNDLIVAINNLFDENVNLKVRNEYLESQLENKKHQKCEMKESIPIDSSLQKIIDYGRKKLFDEVIKNGYSSNINVWKNDKGEIETTSFNKWLENKIYTYNIPDNMSKEDIKNVLYNEITDLYSEEKIKAIAEYESKSDVEENND